MILSLSLVALAVTILAAQRRQQTEREIWQNAVVQKRSPARQIPNIQELPERRYINEQL
jgi:hypothetical protein